MSNKASVGGCGSRRLANFRAKGGMVVFCIIPNVLVACLLRLCLHGSGQIISELPFEKSSGGSLMVVTL